MDDLDRLLLGLALVGTGSALLVSPMCQYRAAWRLAVGDKSARSHILHGGGYIHLAYAMLGGLRSGERHPDAEFRFALGVGLIGFEFGLSLFRDD